MDQNLCQKVWKNEEDDIWEAMTCQKDRQAGRGSEMVQKEFRICEAKSEEKKGERKRKEW